jgi:hypothetical protein
MKKLSCILFCLTFALVLFVGNTASGENAPQVANKIEEPLQIKVTPWGRTQTEVDAAKLRVEESGVVQNALKDTKYRLISFDTIGSEDK